MNIFGADIGWRKMKAILEFNLPKDEGQYHTANKGMDWALLVWDIDQVCRDWIKYDSHKFKTVEDTLEAIRTMIYDKMEDGELHFPP